jgi:hypothetical protein
MAVPFPERAVIRIFEFDEGSEGTVLAVVPDLFNLKTDVLGKQGHGKTDEANKYDQSFHIGAAKELTD